LRLSVPLLRPSYPYCDHQYPYCEYQYPFLRLSEYYPYPYCDYPYPYCDYRYPYCDHPYPYCDHPYLRDRRLRAVTVGVAEQPHRRELIREHMRRDRSVHERAHLPAGAPRLHRHWATPTRRRPGHHDGGAEPRPGESKSTEE
jgi:hypothetical protein